MWLLPAERDQGQSARPSLPRIPGSLHPVVPVCWQRKKLGFRSMGTDATAVHFEAMRAGDAAETSALHLDLLREIRRVNAHLVAAAAYPVLECHGELLPSRLRRDD